MTSDPDHDVEFLIREHFLQSAKVRRVRDIDRRVVREQMHIKFIRDRHVHDLAANQMRLGLLRPGKFVHREKYRKSEFTDLSGDLLVGQGERIEGPRKNATLFPSWSPRHRRRAGSGEMKRPM